MANQRLGAVADLTSVLDTLSRIEREETRSKERIAMQNIRESAATKRQQLRDDRAYREQKERDVYTHNKALLSQYSESDLKKDSEGFYAPKSGTLTYDKQAERVANLEDAIGVHGIDYGGDLYSAYRTSVQRGAAFAENLDYKGDASPGVLTVHDIDMMEETIIQDAKGEYKGLEGIDWEGFGRGVRSGLAANKRIMSADKYQDYLKDKRVIDYSISTFKNHQDIHDIIIVCHHKWIETIKDEYPYTIVCGGKTRQESSLIGLKTCPDNTLNVLIHDSARPFISNKLISKSIELLEKYQAVNISKKVTDTVVIAKDNFIDSIPNRSNVYYSQTPQSFKYKTVHIIKILGQYLGDNKSYTLGKFGRLEKFMLFNVNGLLVQLPDQSY